MPLLQPAALFILVSYFLLSALPFFPILLGKPVEQAWHIITLELLTWLGVWSLCKRPRWFHWLLLPAFFAVPTELYLRLFFGQGISTHHLGIIAETSPKEALEFLGNKVWLLLIVLIAVVAWWWSLLALSKRTKTLDWTHSSRWLAMLVILSGLAVWVYGQQIGIKPVPAKTSASAGSNTADASEDSKEEETGEDNASAPASPAPQASTYVGKQWAKLLPQLPKLAHWAALPYDEELFARTWPFGLVVRGIDFWNERSYLSQLADKSSEFEFKAYQTGDQSQPQIVVVVIGESSRYDRWSLNGYERDTNPLLKLESNLVSFSDVVTAVAATRLSVPIIVSRKPAAQSLKAGFSEKSFISAFKEAGFKTFWLSNQMSFGQFDTPTSVFAKEADVTQFLNLGGFTNSSNFDQILLEPMSNAMRDAAPKKLIVLHTLGNHWNYSHRHPKEYDHWKPSLFGIANPAYTDLKNKQALNNSYDNSILYTDWLLSEVIQKLKASEQVTSMLYVSDHGQTLYDGTCNLAFHGHNTQYEFHIPAFMWYSDAYQAQHPEKIRQLRKHQNAKLSTENVFHSLLDLADIHYPGERLEWSFLNARWQRHIRYVDSYGWTNYDNATFKGDCREVMDKKTPMSQEK
ncbi:lipid A phosphoethanolamine transferase [Undibacterium sp. Jales W-56]|uniref:phosphoethanolamine transferase n=1 Tax=Undibacterium sp. Jales W-56 TaxID=2897325 RepID=UPI0021D37411|nr:phosphoethanolamine transferase [Undibacterium sp. Jales W-56]MCU6435659.1 lipid A phosphoethanolamine transferase [Undibacterium sp. Jales W-56]